MSTSFRAVFRMTAQRNSESYNRDCPIQAEITMQAVGDEKEIYKDYFMNTPVGTLELKTLNPEDKVS